MKSRRLWPVSWGGLNSEITTNTDTVLLESASFANINIRRTARSLGMRTEASLRFERGVDPNGVLFALHRTSMLLKELEAGELGSILDVYPRTCYTTRYHCQP